MQGIVCQQPGKLVFQESAIPVARAGEALLRVRRVGICGTDLHAYAGRQAYFTYPRILGHELAAEVVSVPENSHGIREGDAVAIIPYRHCGACSACRRGFTNCCSNLRVFGVHEDGGMRQHFTYPASLLLKEEGLGLDELALLEPLAIGAHAVRRAGVEAGEFVLVIGAGPIGTGIMKIAQLSGAEVIALDVNPGRLAFCEKALGVRHTVRAGGDARQGLLKAGGGELPTVVFDATGNRQALESGVDFMAHGGRYVLVGLSKGKLSFHHPSIHAREAALLCSRNATRTDFGRAAAMLRQKEFPSEAYISLRASFGEIPGAFGSWGRPEAGLLKVMTIW